MLVLVLVVLTVFSTIQCYLIVWDNTANTDFNEIDSFGRMEEVRIANQFFIFPGTKWCGPGNIASDNFDLGVHRDTDKCCREHDFCPDIIKGYDSNHGLTNPSFYTRVNCECDTTFYQCLKSVNSQSSNQVGHVYFTLLGTQCFKEEFPITGCNKYTYFPMRKCVDYMLNESGEKSYQFFDVPNF